MIPIQNQIDRKNILSIIIISENRSSRSQDKIHEIPSGENFEMRSDELLHKTNLFGSILLLLDSLCYLLIYKA